MRKITWSPEIQWSWVMRTLLSMWGDGKIKVTYEVSGTCTPLQLLKSSVKIEVMDSHGSNRHFVDTYGVASLLKAPSSGEGLPIPLQHHGFMSLQPYPLLLLPPYFQVASVWRVQWPVMLWLAMDSWMPRPCPLVDSLNGATLWQTAPSSALRLVRAEAFLRPLSPGSNYLKTWKTFALKTMKEENAEDANVDTW